MGEKTIKYYLPNSRANSNYDFVTPTNINWSSSLAKCNVDDTLWADSDNPINRIVKLSDNYGFATGYIIGYGIAKKNLAENTYRTFELRNNSGKIYSLPFNVNGGRIVDVGDNFSVVMYKSWFDRSVLNDAEISKYSININGDTYVYIDFSKSTTEIVDVSEELNGKSIELIEARNCELKSDVYNEGFLLSSSYVSGETSYVVVRIK